MDITFEFLIKYLDLDNKNNNYISTTTTFKFYY